MDQTNKVHAYLIALLILLTGGVTIHAIIGFQIGKIIYSQSFYGAHENLWQLGIYLLYIPG